LKPFTLALVQLGQIGGDKSANLSHARDMIRRAASGDGDSQRKPDLIVLPVCCPFLLFHSFYLNTAHVGVLDQECFNSPYGHVHFPKYAEVIDFEKNKGPNPDTSSLSESLKMLREAAIENGAWILGGAS
jgi:hypothetical protein